MTAAQETTPEPVGTNHDNSKVSLLSPQVTTPCTEWVRPSW